MTKTILALALYAAFATGALAQAPEPYTPAPVPNYHMPSTPDESEEEKCRDDCHNRHCPCYRGCYYMPQSDECKKQCDKQSDACKKGCSPS